MPGYAHAVNEDDAWAIVAYIRVLQAARTNVENVPPTEREQLRNVPKPASKVVPDAAPAPAPAPSTPTPTTGTPGGTTK